MQVNKEIAVIPCVGMVESVSRKLVYGNESIIHVVPEKIF